MRDVTPVDEVETHKTLCWWIIDKTSLVCAVNAPYIPEQPVY
jgi:hypothetical protein